jgi:opacity protein-like surface antigen
MSRIFPVTGWNRSPTAQGGSTVKKSLLVIAALVALAMPAICNATPPRPGPYVSGFAGVSVPQDTDATTTEYFNNDAVFNERVGFDPGVYAGGTAGFDFGFLRLEGEISYRDSEINSVTDQSSGFRYSGVDGNLGALAVMANAFFDMHNATPITPYWGGGIGFAAMHVSDTHAFDGQSVQHLYPEDDDTVFAYQVGAGLEIALNPMVSLDVGYRYFGTSKPTFESGSLSTTNLKMESHNALVGVRVKF